MESYESWLIDSGCTNHMTYNKDLFTQLGEASSSKVRMGDGKHVTVKGKGTIVISTFFFFFWISKNLYI